MSPDEMTLILHRLGEEFGNKGPGRDTYRHHLGDLDAAEVNAAITACARDGLFTRPMPGDIFARLPRRVANEPTRELDPDAFYCWGCKKKHNPMTSNGLAHCPACQAERLRAWDEKRGAVAA